MEQAVIEVSAADFRQAVRGCAAGVTGVTVMSGL